MIPLGALSAFANFLARPAQIIGRAQDSCWDDALDELDDDRDETGRSDMWTLLIVCLVTAAVACAWTVMLLGTGRGA